MPPCDDYQPHILFPKGPTARIQAGLNIEELLNTSPALGVELIADAVRHHIDEIEHRVYVERCIEVNVDPDALLLTARKNAELMTALEHARELTAQEIFAKVEACMRLFEDDDDGYILKKCEFEFFMKEIKMEYLKGETFL